MDLGEEIDHKWLSAIKENENSEEKLLLVGSKPTSGMLGLIYTLLQEMGTEKVR